MKPTKEVSIEEVKFVSPEDYLQTVEDNNWQSQNFDGKSRCVGNFTLE